MDLRTKFILDFWQFEFLFHLHIRIQLNQVQNDTLTLWHFDINKMKGWFQQFRLLRSLLVPIEDLTSSTIMQKCLVWKL
jgi:hypothetical protein